jgi:hypothetical protein
MTTWRISLREHPLVFVDVENGDLYAMSAFLVARPLLEKGLQEKLGSDVRPVVAFSDCNYRKIGRRKAAGVRP